MSWKGVTIMDQRICFIAEYLNGYFPVDELKNPKGDVGSNTTLHCKRKDLNGCSPTRIPVQTEIDIAAWEE